MRDLGPVTGELRLSADIGGTFTDLVLETAGQRLTRKVLTTPARPEEGVLEGMGLLLAEAGRDFSDIDVFVHGTTLATNAIIERRGAAVALIATEGFRDILEIAGESRYDQYDLFLEKPLPLVERALCFTVPERLDAEGRVVTPLDEAAVRALAPALRAAGVESVAIALMHGYRNDSHERRIAAILTEEMPGLFITLASEVCAEIREYERTSTAVANAYVQPLMASYLARMSADLQRRGYRGATYLVTSGGGLTTIATASHFPVRLVESGPAGGAIFAARLAEALGEDRILSFDMGGTTAKVCLIDDGAPASSRFFEVDRVGHFRKGSGLPLRIPVIEMVEIGAGGGSIGRVDALKRVVVGPESASSVPGPACYGRGGERPAVTDADLVLGLLDADRFAGGRIRLDPKASEAALSRAIGDALEMSAARAAYAMHEVVCENMASAARIHAIERGVVPEEYTLMAFGGAAPLHAARVAEKIGVPRVIVPPNAGVGSAVGFLAAPIAFEIVRSRHVWVDTMDGVAVHDWLTGIAAEARAHVAPGALGAPLVETRTAFMRYYGQGHEIGIVLPDGPLTEESRPALRAAYEREYEKLFNRIIPGAEIEIMSWSVLVSTVPVVPPRLEDPARSAASAPVAMRMMFDGRSDSSIEVPVYLRPDLVPGASLSGPAVIVEDETSTFVSASFTAHIGPGGCIVMDRKPQPDANPADQGDMQ